MSCAAGAAAEAPDVAGTIEAWRVWRVIARDDGYSLGSIVKPTLWPAGEPLDAQCLHSRPLLGWMRRRPEHDAPEPKCECGIYAADLDHIGPYLSETWMQVTVARVIGQVSLWGTVIECERGFRASHAYPLRIYVPADARAGDGGDRQELLEGLAGYGVPVEPLPARCADAARVLA